MAAWRDFEDRYQRVLATLWLTVLMARTGLNMPTTPASGTHGSRDDVFWENADYDAERQAKAVERTIDFAQENASQEWRWEDMPEVADEIFDGHAAWLRLAEEVEFDLHGMFRRRALVPFVLVPRHVATRYGAGDKLSMLQNLQQVHDAFVFGTQFAALAMMRSILEAVLRDYYHAQGDDLCEMIDDHRLILPKFVYRHALHRLRKLANAVLHLDEDKEAGLSTMDERQLEIEIVGLLLLVRTLIEGAK